MNVTVSLLIPTCVVSNFSYYLVHHIQHHTQPVTASEELPEQHRNVVRFPYKERLYIHLNCLLRLIL